MTDIDELVSLMNTATIIKEKNTFEEFEELIKINDMLEDILNNPETPRDREYVHCVLFNIMKKYLMFVNTCNENSKILFIKNPVYIEIEWNIRNINFSDYNKMIFDCYTITNKIIELVDDPFENSDTCSDICFDIRLDSDDQMDL